MYKVNNRNTIARCEIYSKLTIKAPERRLLYSLKTSENRKVKIVKDILQFRDAVLYLLRKQTDFQIPSVHSAFSDTEIIKYLGETFGKFTS